MTVKTKEGLSEWTVCTTECSKELNWTYAPDRDARKTGRSRSGLKWNLAIISHQPIGESLHHHHQQWHPARWWMNSESGVKIVNLNVINGKRGHQPLWRSLRENLDFEDATTKTDARANNNSAWMQFTEMFEEKHRPFLWEEGRKSKERRINRYSQMRQQNKKELSVNFCFLRKLAQNNWRNRTQNLQTATSPKHSNLNHLVKLIRLTYFTNNRFWFMSLMVGRSALQPKPWKYIL